MTKEVLIFCESYPQIKNTLYVATHQNDQAITIAIPGHHDLLSFFRLVNDKVFENTLDIVYFDIYPGRTGKAGSRIVKALYLLPEIVRERRYLKSIFNKHFSHLREAEVFFFSRCFNPSTFYMLERLDKTNRLVYMPDPGYDAITINKTAPANITELVYLIKCKLVYGYDISLGKHPLGQKITRMPDKFFRNRIKQLMSREERDNMLQDFDLNKFKVFDDGNYSIMYFHDDLVEHDYIAEPAEFERKLADAFNILGKHFSKNKVALKYHPGYTQSETGVPFGSKLPDFIPAELLYNDKIKMYLGISSMALANVEKGLAVSLIDMVDFKNDTIREQLKEALIHWSHSEILFPKSLDEFERILIRIRREG